jgi:hypothetical protein
MKQIKESNMKKMTKGECKHYFNIKRFIMCALYLKSVISEIAFVIKYYSLYAIYKIKKPTIKPCKCGCNDITINTAIAYHFDATTTFKCSSCAYKKEYTGIDDWESYVMALKLWNNSADKKVSEADHER